jgi:hypothetical protein
MDLNPQINSNDYLQMEDQLTIGEIDRILHFPISDTRRRELNHVQGSKFNGVRWPSDTYNDLYSFIHSFMGSGSAASTQQSGNLCVSDLQKNMIFSTNELKEYSDIILTNVGDNPGNIGDLKGIVGQIENSIIGIHNNKLLEDPEQITESPKLIHLRKLIQMIPILQKAQQYKIFVLFAAGFEIYFQWRPGLLIL